LHRFYETSFAVDNTGAADSLLFMASVQTWFQAMRPRTLPAAAAPVLCGSALAFHAEGFQALPALVCLLFALLVQVGTNFANDYFDFKKGADTPERIGPTRAVAAGLIAPQTMWRATLAVLALAFIVGLALVYWGGWWLVLIGVASIACAVLYTGGPFPIAYHGLGDLFVFVFFGLVAVVFTYFVQAGHFAWEAGLVGSAVGLLSVNLLVVNNYRDAESDARARKRTLVVLLGKSFARWEYGLGMALALLIPLVMVVFGQVGWLTLLPLLLTPLAMRCQRNLSRARTREDFGKLLANTAKLLTLYAVLLSTGLVADRLL